MLLGGTCATPNEQSTAVALPADFYKARLSSPVRGTSDTIGLSAAFSCSARGYTEDTVVIVRSKNLWGRGARCATVTSTFVMDRVGLLELLRVCKPVFNAT